jgi:PBP1b-binding outer membrane lipoprotein LpoB
MKKASIILLFTLLILCVNSCSNNTTKVSKRSLKKEREQRVDAAQKITTPKNVKGKSLNDPPKKDLSKKYNND